MAKVRNFPAVLMPLLLSSSVAIAAPANRLEQLQHEQLVLLAEVRHDLHRIELELHETADDDPRLTERRRVFDRMKAQFRLVEERTEVEQRDQIVYVSAGSRDPQIANYYLALKERIERAGTNNFPKVDGKSARGSAAALLDLDRAGNVRRIEIVSSTGSELRQHVEDLLRSLSPFQPLPADVASKAKRVVFITSFVYAGTTRKLDAGFPQQAAEDKVSPSTDSPSTAPAH